MRVGAELHGGPHRDDLYDAAVDVVVVGHGVGREDHGHAGRGDGGVDQADRADRRRRGGRPGVGLDEGAVLGDVAQDAGAQGGDGQAELESGTGDQRRIDGTDAVGPLVQRLFQRVEVEHRAPARAQASTHAGQAEPGTREQAQCVALATPAGASGLASGAPVRGGGWHGLLTGGDDAGREGEGRAGALREFVLDLSAEAGAVEGAEPRLLPEDALGGGHGHDVVLDFADALHELGMRTCLGQHRGRDGARRRGRHDVGGDPLHLDQVLQGTHLEGALRAAAGQDERGGARGGGGRHSDDSSTVTVA